jgi:hypothetical protein
MGTVETLSAAAGRTWLDGWTAGRVEAGGTGLVRLPYVYPYSEAFPQPGGLVAAARLSRHVTETGLYATS